MSSIAQRRAAARREKLLESKDSRHQKLVGDDNAKAPIVMAPSFAEAPTSTAEVDHKSQVTPKSNQRTTEVMTTLAALIVGMICAAMDVQPTIFQFLTGELAVRGKPVVLAAMGSASSMELIFKSIEILSAAYTDVCLFMVGYVVVSATI